MFPLLSFSHPFWSGSDDWEWPELSRIFDQNFASDVLSPDLLDWGPGERMDWSPYRRRRPKRAHSDTEATSIGGFSEVRNNKDKFVVSLDVSQFAPEELKVKTTDRMFIIEGNQPERTDEYGSICRSFIRKYLLPKEVDAQKVTSKLSSDGLLTVEAPKLAIETAKQEREVPVQVVDERRNEEPPQKITYEEGGKSPLKHQKKH